MKYVYLLAALIASVGSLAAELVPTPVDEITTIYRCYRDPGYAYPVCIRVPVQTGNLQPVSAPELAAAQQTALLALPVEVQLDPDAPVQLCHPTTHGASGCCKIVAITPEGDYIIECGSRVGTPEGLPVSWWGTGTTTEACSASTHGDCSERCRIIYTDPYNPDATPIGLVVCGDDQ